MSGRDEKAPRTELRLMEGRRVNVRLHSGCSMYDHELVSAGRLGVTTLWLYAGGLDVFVPVEDVVDVTEMTQPGEVAA
jgi:hypothetical protein